MQATNHSDERHGRRRVEVTRGLIVIVLAVIVGAFVVTQGLTDDAESAAGSDVAAVGSEPAALEGGDGEGGSADGADDAADDAVDDIGGATAERDPGAEAAGGDADPAAPDASSDGGEAGAAADDGSADSTGAGDGDGSGDDDGSASDADAGEVQVLVLNGAGAKGIAARGSAILQDAGYDVLAPRNANFLGPSKILFTSGFEAAATDIAAAYSVDPAAVVEPLDPASPPINDTHGADVIVVVGEDGLIQV